MSIQSEINRIAGAKSDIADAIEDQGVTVPSGTKLDGMANLIGQISGGSEKLNSTQAADAYDPTATYAVGDKVSYAGNVYSCISAISTPEAWDSTHWDQVDPIQGQIDDVRNTLNHLEDGLAIIVDGDTCTTAVPVGGYAYIKNNTHGLAEGLYTNTSASTFPTSGGAANSSVFTAVSGGGLNSLKNSIDSLGGFKITTFEGTTPSTGGTGYREECLAFEPYVAGCLSLFALNGDNNRWYALPIHEYSTTPFLDCESSKCYLRFTLISNSVYANRAFRVIIIYR